MFLHKHTRSPASGALHLVSFHATLLFAFCVEMGSHCVSLTVTLLSQRLGVMADYQFE